MIPTKEQFDDLQAAYEEIDLFSRCCPIDESGAMLLMQSDMEMLVTSQKFATSWEEKTQKFKELPATAWLLNQQNFTHAKNKIWTSTISDISSSFIERTNSSFQRRIAHQEALSTGTVKPEWYDRNWETGTPGSHFLGALNSTWKSFRPYSKWVAALASALCSYHYSNRPVITNKKTKAAELIATWDKFCILHDELINDEEVINYLPSPDRLKSISRRVDTFRDLHATDSLYFISREDDSVRNRLFIQNLALLNKGMFGHSFTSSIHDLFYLEGMNSSPNERTIQRIVKEAIAHENKKKAAYRASDTKVAK